MQYFRNSIALILCPLLLVAYAAPLLVPRGLLGTTWIEASISSDVFLNKPEDKEAFSTTLTGVKLGQRLTPRGKYNAVLKVMKSTNKAALGEVKALHQVGDLVASGMLRDILVARNPVPVIIMLKKSGDVLSTTKAYQDANVAIRERMRAESNTIKCERVASLAVTRHILHLDNHEANGLVTLSGNTVTSVELIDYGTPDTYLVSKNAKKADVLDFCLKRLKSKAQSA